MNTFEIEKLSIAATNFSTAETLLGSFFEEYLADAKCKTLKYDAEYRPEMIGAKISAVLSIMHEALLDLEAVVDPDHSNRVALYLNDADRLQAYIRERKSEQSVK